MALIELDLDAPPGDHHPRLPPARVFRWIGLTLVGVLALTLGGAAPFAPVLWRQVGSVPVAEDGWFRLVGDRLYTYDVRSVAAWDLGPNTLRWTLTPTVVSPDEADQSTGGALAVAGDSVVLQSPRWRTVVADHATGRVRWQSPGPVEIVTGEVGLTRDVIFRPGSEYAEAGITPGGEAYLEPPERTVLNGVDLATGRQLWSLTGAGAVFTELVGDLLLVMSADRLALVDPRTGAIVRERAAADQSFGWVVGDTALGRHGAEMIAYDLATLTPRWRAPADRAGSDLAGGRCDGLICRLEPESIQVLDPATGAVRWQVSSGLVLRRVGDAVLETDVLAGRPLRLLDAVTGEVRAPVDDWSTAIGREQPLLARLNLARAGWEFAALRDGQVRPLGFSPVLVHDCQGSARFVACRTPTGVEVFRIGPS